MKNLDSSHMTSVLTGVMASYGGRSNSFSYRGRGRGGRNFPPFNKQVVNSDISGLSLLKKLENNPDALKKVQQMLGETEEKSSSSSSYANIVAEIDENDSYEKKVYNQEEILSLDHKDLKWKDEPWQLIQRYLGTASYTAGSYKQRSTFESILRTTETCDIRHFFPSSQTNIFNFSKIIFKQIISVEEWGISPFGEKEFKTPAQNILVKFNFWDYKEAFYKVFLYQNPQRKHTWFLKMCPQIYKRNIPNWFYDWWHRYGAEENILPKQFLDLFHKWREVSPAIIEAEHNTQLCLDFEVIHFFCEFGIPWIYRWEPEVSYTQNNIPCLKRTGYIKFWKKMIRLDDNGSMEGQETIDLIKRTISLYEGHISDNLQREAPNPFDVMLRRSFTPHMSRQDQIDQFMKEAQEAILKKLGPDTDLPRNLSDKSSSVQDSQEPDVVLSEKEMAEFYSKLCSRSLAKGNSSGSNSMDISIGEPDNQDFDEELKGSRKKKKGKGRR